MTLVLAFYTALNSSLLSLIVGSLDDLGMEFRSIFSVKIKTF